ncbi:hypothetical protein ABBQ32_011180 [Trebouxia sp. C0010 RCD-2024]
MSVYIAQAAHEECHFTWYQHQLWLHLFTKFCHSSCIHSLYHTKDKAQYYAAWLQIDTKKLTIKLCLNSQDDLLLIAMLAGNACSTTDWHGTNSVTQSAWVPVVSGCNTRLVQSAVRRNEEVDYARLATRVRRLI